MKRRRPIARVSKKQAKRLTEYARRKKEFLMAHRHCRPTLEQTGQLVKATEIHHMRGRAGKLLLDERFWLPVCREQHRCIHNSPMWARQHGYLCQAGEWNKQP